MQLKRVNRVCRVCKQEYDVSIDDNIDLCHTCYLLAERQIRQGKISGFNEYKMKVDDNRI